MHLDKYLSYIELLRLNRPIGIWLLLWPCFCALAISHGNIGDYILFFIGTIALRSAGCVMNDMADVKFDRHVKRSKNRPLATQTVNQIEALILTTVCLSMGLYVWFQLTYHAKLLSLVGALMMVIYPFLKRITYWPQIFLGFTFNIGFLIALLHKNTPIKIDHILLYTTLILWTVFYDTIYAFADIKDDVKIGVKSSAIKMQKYPKIWLTLINLTSAVLFMFSLNNYLISFIGFMYLQYLLHTWQPNSDESCITTFKKCHYFGLCLWLSLEFIRIITP